MFEVEDENDEIVKYLIQGLSKNVYDTEKKEKILKYEDFQIDLEKKTIFKNKNEIHLTKVEFKILSLFFENPERVFSKEQIYNAAWEETSESCIHAVENMISRLRKKIEDDSSKPMYIITVPGFGYKLSYKNIRSEENE